MLILMALLVFLRLRVDSKDVGLWLAGLGFVFLEGVAADSYRSSAKAQLVSHAVALSAYVLGGVTFAWAARKDSFPLKPYLSFCVVTALPLLVLSTLYGMGSHRRGFYVWTLVASLLLSLSCTAVFLRSVRTIAVALGLQVLLWAPMLWLAERSGFRELVYWGLGCEYLLVAVALWDMMKRSRIGGIIMVAGFVFWSLCLFTHPYVRPNSVAAGVNDQVWTLQKFFVTIGLLLVLLDEQGRRNRELALHDSLTGLPNRRLMEDRLSQAMERSERYGTKFAVFEIDLNGFKAVNDAAGHHRGNEVLREVARRLGREVRAADTLARCGGDEFTVIVNNVSGREVCELIARKLRTSLEDLAPEVPGVLSGSVGYALYPEDAINAAVLQQIADQRMYAEKRAVRDASLVD